MIEKRTILLVDDNEATATLVTALLHRDFEVETARDGSEAIEKLKTSRYAAVLLDLRMPHTDGFGVLDFIRDNAPDVMKRVLVLTAALSPNEVARARGYEICGIVSKPFEVEELLARVKECAGREEGNGIGSVIYSSTGVILLLADLIKGRWIS